MEIKLMQYEVLEAIEDYIKKNHSFEIDINDQLEEYPSIAYLERTYGPQKYKTVKLRSIQNTVLSLMKLSRPNKNILPLAKTVTLVFT